MSSKPTVWFVDDLKSNLDAFVEAHGDTFDVETFSEPRQVLNRLLEKTPDALLCDIYFYDTPFQAKNNEKQIQDEIFRLKQFFRKIGADKDKYLAGIDLIERVMNKFNNLPPFPVYAYTSKGPYTLSDSELDRIVKTNAEILFKGRCSRDVERKKIIGDIEKYRKQNTIYMRLSSHVIPFLLGWGIIGWMIGKLLENLLRLILQHL